MTVRGLISALTQQEDLNFLLTNRIPRAALTRFMGWFSKIENPLVRDASGDGAESMLDAILSISEP